MDILEEVTLGMRAVYAPEVVDEDVEDAEGDHEEGGGPFGLEADSDHNAGGKTNKGDEETGDAPLSSDHEPEEEEDEQDASSEQETKGRGKNISQ